MLFHLKNIHPHIPVHDVKLPVTKEVADRRSLMSGKHSAGRYGRLRALRPELM